MNMNTPSKYAIRVTKYGHSDDHLLYGSSHAEAYTLFTGVVERAEQVDGWRTDWIDENTVEMHKPGHTMMLVELVEVDAPLAEPHPLIQVNRQWQSVEPVRVASRALVGFGGGLR